MPQNEVDYLMQLAASVDSEEQYKMQQNNHAPM